MSIWQYHSLMKCSVPLPKPSQIDFTQILIYIYNVSKTQPNIPRPQNYHVIDKGL